MKRKILVFSLIILCFASLTYGTAAYFTADGIATNVITAGNIRIDLIETAVNEEGQRVPFEDQICVLPDTDVSKIVEVKNVGDHPAFIRVLVEKVIELRSGEAGDTALMTYDLNTDSWTEKDGYYYYNHIVPPGELTQPLFTTVHFDKAMGNSYKNSTAHILIDAQATQAKHNGPTALDAAGWPES